MKIQFKRVLSFVLALVMVAGMIPAIAPHVHAAGTLSTISGLGASWTDASSSSGKASWSASGTSITGTATGYTQLFWGRTITTKLTLTNISGGEATLRFNYTLTGGGSVSGISDNEYEGNLADGASLTITLTSPSGSSTNTLSITNLSLISTSAADVTTTFKPAAGGSFTVGGTAVTAETTKTEAAGTGYTLVATPASGYMFLGWYNETNGSYLDYNTTYKYNAVADAVIVPKFVSSTTALFGVGAAKFDNLTDACTYAASSTIKTVVLLNNGTVTGSHTIPAGVTLLIPFNDSNTLYTNAPACTSSFANNVAWVQPTAYRTLTLAADAKITVNGAMSLSAQHAAANGGANYCGSPTGPVSFVNMMNGSNITVNNGGNLYAWGFITGSGSVTANSGATVYENFQITDFRGGTATGNYVNTGLAFPLNQYYVQNIEVPVTFYAGATEKIYTSAYSSGMCLSGEATFIGTGGMFTSNAGGYVIKDFVESQDRLNVDLYGNCELNSMKVKLSIEVDSANYILPITNNVSIGIHTGTTTLKQSVALLPGVKVTVDQGATLNLAYSGTDINDYCTDGYSLVAYDRDEWFYGLSMDTGEQVTGVKYGNVLHSSASVPNGYSAKPSYFVPVLYAPGRTSGRTDADLQDAVLDINGTLLADGFIYTTMGGASIISSGKTGKIQMVNGSGADVLSFQNNGTTSTTLGFMIYSAWLKNGDGSYLQTATYGEDGNVTSGSAPGTTYAYCEMHDQWYTGLCEKCESVSEYTITFYDDEGNKLDFFDIEEGSTPAYSGEISKDYSADDCHEYEFVGWATSQGGAVITIPAATADADYYAVFELVTNENHNTDEFLYNANGDGTHQKLLACCGEVVNAAETCTDGTDKDHNCDNCGAANIEDHTPGTAVEEDRVEATCGTAGSYNSVVYCTECGEELSSTPNTIPATGNHVDGDDDDHDCDNCDATNVDDGHFGGTATCVALAVCDECGQSYGAYGDHEYNQTAYTNITATHHTVSHICKYDATHIENDEPVEHTYVDGVCVCKATKTYTITWIVDGVETKANVAHGAVPTAPAAEKADTAEYDYTFSHWVDADGKEYTEIPAATADVTYTAVYTSVKQVYTITWNIEGVETTDSVAYGETPVYSGTPTKAATAEYSYTFSGWSPAVTSVTGNATYTAQFAAEANQYVLTFDYNYEAYLKQLPVDYNVTVAADSMKYYSTHSREGYTLTGWNTAADGSGEPFDMTKSFTMPAHDVTIYAQWEVSQYTITWKDDEGNTIDTTTVEHGTVPTHADASKAATAQYTYTFAGWYPEVVAATGDASYSATFRPVLRSYDITFVVDGVETKASTKYGETPVYPNGTPTKATDAYYTYEFAGWTPEVVDVTGEATYTATWTETPVEHTITFVIDGETFHVVSGGYSTTADYSELPSTDKTGYTFNGWDKELPTTIPAEDMVITGSYTVNQYSITFKNDFNITEDDAFADYTITKNYGEAITEADIAALEAKLPTMTGWEFKGWYYAEEVEIEGNKVWKHTSEYAIPETMGAADVTVYANWEQIYYILNVLSSIDNEFICGANMLYEEYYETLEDFNRINAFCYDDSCVNEYHAHLLPEGYSYAGYKYTDGTDVTFPYSHPAEDVTIVAQFVPKNYTVTFMNGDETYHQITAPYGSAITMPENPTKEGYVFAGWVDAEGKAVDLSTMPLDGMDVFATFAKDSFKLNFFATEGDATAAATFDVTYGTELTEEYMAELLVQVSAPTKEGHTFQNWNVSGVPATMPAEAVNVYGNWSVNSYNVNWVIDGETYATTSVAYGSAITEPDAPVKEGYTFSGWTDIPVTMPAEDVTVTGSWNVNTYTITFDVEGIDPITAEYGAEITWPEYPTKTGHMFWGWDKNNDGESDFIDLKTMPAEDLNLKAVWVKNTYWIYWNVEGQELAQQYKYGDTITPYGEPTKAADEKWTYKLVGWKNTSDEIVEFPATVTENMTYYAVFEQDEAVKYTVKFVDGENTVYETQVAWNSEVTLEGFEAPTKDHYTLSWTVDGAEVSFPYAMDTKEVTFVANWIPNTYSIYFYASQNAYNNGEVLHKIEAAFNTEVAGYSYTAPEGWNFDGWKTNGNLDFFFPYMMGGEDVHLIAQTSRQIFTATFVNGDWSRTYHVGYDNPVSLSVNGTLDTPKDHDGYAFKGWFDENGVAYTDEYVMPAHNVTFTAKWAYTGWYTDDIGTTYLFDDEKAYFGVWVNIGGDEYWFDANSYIAKDITLISGKYYAFDHESGKFLGDYTGIYTANNVDLYYVENGVAVANKGLVKTVDADGHIHYYYFGCSETDKDSHADNSCNAYLAQKNTVHWVENNNGYLVQWDYTFDENGVIVHDEDTSKNGVHLDNGVKYYYIDGVKVHFGLFIGEDGEYYYARSNGSLVVSRDYWISESHLNGVMRDGAPVEEGSYTFDEEGRIVWPVIVKSGIYAEDGSLYYYVDGVRTYAGLIKFTGELHEGQNSIDGVYSNDVIYVRTNGELAVNRSYWATKNNGLMASASYNFDEYGRMIRTNGLIEEDGGLYYYVNGSRYHAGLIKIDGSFYYIKSSGQAVAGCRYWITHTNGYEVSDGITEGSYEFAADGKMIIPEPVAVKNGIVEEDGKLVYYVDGKLNYAGLIQYTGSLTTEDGTVIEGAYENAWIYVRTSGELVVGRSYWATKNNGYMKSATYQFDENGIMLNPSV